MRKICFCIFVFFMFFTSCKADKNINEGINWKDIKRTKSMELSYAEKFSVDYYGDYKLITIVDGEKFLVVPEDVETPNNIDEDITIIKQPVENIYLSATSAIDLFRALDSFDTVKFFGTDAQNIHIKEAKEAVESGDIIYAGKYNMPDYELILANDCGIAIESTMLYHSPEVKEKLEKLGIPVIVERSSYEPHPIGRMEWLKLYSVLLSKEYEAKKIIDEQIHKLNSLVYNQSNLKTVAFFYITNAGYANVRKPNDYISKMIGIAGGKYIFDSLDSENNALSTVNMQIEKFYYEAKDADILIYNSTIDGGIKTLDELISKNELLGDFKAVKNKNVWCTTQNMFQETMSITDMIVDFNCIINDNESVKPKYIYRLE